jgi:hypothetical protein
MVPNLMIYRQPYKRLIIPDINENSADVRVMGLAAASIWSIVRIALPETRLGRNRCKRGRKAYDSSRADMILRVCHSCISESMKLSQEERNFSRFRGTAVRSWDDIRLQ